MKADVYYVYTQVKCHAKSVETGLFEVVSQLSQEMNALHFSCLEV